MISFAERALHVHALDARETSITSFASMYSDFVLSQAVSLAFRVYEWLFRPLEGFSPPPSRRKAVDNQRISFHFLAFR